MVASYYKKHTYKKKNFMLSVDHFFDDHVEYRQVRP